MLKPTFFRTCVTLAVVLVAGLSPAARGEPADAPIASRCRAIPSTDSCRCWMETTGADVTFPEAAGRIEWVFRQTGDRRYIDLMATLLRQCRIATATANANQISDTACTPNRTGDYWGCPF